MRLEAKKERNITNLQVKNMHTSSKSNTIFITHNYKVGYKGQCNSLFFARIILIIYYICLCVFTCAYLSLCVFNLGLVDFGL